MSNATRREFVKQSAALGLGLGLAARLDGEQVAANDKISVACIGVRGQGRRLMQKFAEEPDCVVTHVCDVNEQMRESRGAQLEEQTGRKPKLVNDYRTLLDDKSIDAFVVATPDHWHALITIDACLAGKDVYVEKPASHNIREGTVAVAAARRHNRIVQLGTMLRSASYLQEAAEYVRSGELGKVIYGKAWETDRNSEVHLPPDSEAPSDFDYELWQGPAPERTFNQKLVANSWRWFFDYGTGDLGNDGVHRIDYCRYVMGIEEMPSAINCSGGMFFFDDDQQWPDTMLVSYEYPRHVLQYEMRLWSRPRLLNLTEGAAIYGENGWVLVTNNSWKAFDAKNKLVKEGGSKDALEAHIRNFLDAVRSRQRDALNQEIYPGHVSTMMCHAGNISWRTGKKIRFNAESETFDDPDANHYLGREHRQGYELPEIG